jgi:protein-disulfide isomerase-like protein with CxxC motif
VPPAVDVLHFSDPGCPWAYSASPALALLHWRYGDQLAWRLITIGLAEDPQRYVDRGYTPTMMAQGYRGYRRYGMPFASQPRERVTATGRACRAIVATRLLDPAREYDVFRALQFGQFTTTRLHDTEDGLRESLHMVPGLDVAAILGALDDEGVERAYQADRAEARTAAGSPTEFQGKAADTDGAVRYTAPSLIFRHRDGRVLEAGGFQPAEAYDVVLANLDTSLQRRPPADDPIDVLGALPYTPTTREVAACLAPHLGVPDDDAAETALIEAAGRGLVRREAIGDGALWHLLEGQAAGSSALAA